MVRGWKMAIACTACMVCGARLDAQTVQSAPKYIVALPPFPGANGEIVEPSPDFQPKWVWSVDPVDDGTSLFIRQRFTLAQKPEFARLEITVDDEFTVKLNGNPVFSEPDTDWTSPEANDGVQDLLQAGINEVVITATNRGGPAGAIVLIRLVDSNGIRFVGTGDNSETSKDEMSWNTAKSLGDKFAEPWKLVTPESEQQKLARKEAWSLVGEIEGPSTEASARAIVYLAYLGVEFFDTDFYDPITSITGDAPDTSILNKAIEVIRENLYSNVSAKRNAAINAARYILTSKDSVELLVDQIQGDFATCGECGDNLQLAILGQIATLLESDKQAVDVAKKAVDAKTAERKSKIAELKSKQAEIDGIQQKIKDLSFRLDANERKAKDLESKEEDLEIKEKELSGKLTGPPVPSEDEKQKIQRDIAANKKDKTANEIDKTANGLENDRLNKQRNNQFAELAVLQDALATLTKQLAAIDGKLSDLEGKRDAALGIATLRLKQFEKLVNACTTNCSRIVLSINQQTQEQIRKLRLGYADISSFADADTFFASAAATGSFSTSQPGARTSAADLPGVADRTVGERPGVSETAPYDPARSGRARTFYPSTDDRGQRKKQDNSKIPESKVEKAPGATGAVSAIPKKE